MMCYQDVLITSNPSKTAREQSTVARYNSSCILLIGQYTRSSFFLGSCRSTSVFKRLKRNGDKIYNDEERI